MVATVSHLPLGAARWLGRTLGLLAYVFAQRSRRTGLENLRHAFPDHDERERRKILRHSFQHSVTVITETLVVRRWSSEKIARAFGLREELERFRRQVPEGGVAVTAHFGNWEVLGLLIAAYHPGLLVVGAARNPNQRIQAWLDRSRRAAGLRPIYSDESPRRFLEALREKRILVLLPDQTLRTPNGLFVPFFGRPAYTTSLPAHLARSARRPVLVGLFPRRAKGFEIIFHPQVNPPWTNDRAADLRQTTERFSQVIEEEIRKRPEQWVWFHRRWRLQPGDEKRYSSARWMRRRSQR